MNDSNEDESSEDEALSIIQETSEQDITENIELLQVNVDVHQTSTSGRVRYTSHPMPQSTSLNIKSDVYNTSEQNTEMSLGSESNNESYNEIFEDYSPPPYQANMDAEENPIDDNFSWILLVQAKSIYLFARFRQQLSDMFCQPEFEKSL
ncbi:hypothetical protein GLOIN_2v1480991 [Rhizophagus irregularis DAOM 181602=DAOM 197198]|nr:hypothetical protein GLOIN_2v1480991 [Rhizophagus irregularis DAOM 181602=DAOM 197198]